MENVLVVGGAGYIGGALVDQLKLCEVDVTVYDNLAYENRFLKDVPFIRGDIRDRAKLSEILRKFDTVFWLAAVVGDGACAADPYLTQQVNEDTVKWFVDNYDGRIVFPSTCSVYGVNNDLINELATPKPLSVYAETKLAAEQYILSKASDRSLVFRLGTLFGLGDKYSRIRLDLVVNILAKRAVQGEVLRVFGGEQWRPLIHVKDVARAMFFGADTEITGLYNLASGNYKIREIAEAVQASVPDVQVEFVKSKFEDLRNYKVDTSKWMKTINYKCWSPRWSLNQGIFEVVQVIREHRLKDPDDAIYSNEQFIHGVYRRWM